MTYQVAAPAWFLVIGSAAMWLPTPSVAMATVLLAVAVFLPLTLVLFHQRVPLLQLLTPAPAGV